MFRIQFLPSPSDPFTSGITNHWSLVYRCCLRLGPFWPRLVNPHSFGNRKSVTLSPGSWTSCISSKTQELHLSFRKLVMSWTTCPSTQEMQQDMEPPFSPWGFLVPSTEVKNDQCGFFAPRLKVSWTWSNLWRFSQRQDIYHLLVYWSTYCNFIVDKSPSRCSNIPNYLPMPIPSTPFQMIVAWYPADSDSVPVSVWVSLSLSPSSLLSLLHTCTHAHLLGCIPISLFQRSKKYPQLFIRCWTLLMFTLSHRHLGVETHRAVA